MRKTAVYSRGHSFRTYSDALETILESSDADKMLTLAVHPWRDNFRSGLVAHPDVTAILLIDLRHHSTENTAMRRGVTQLLERYEAMDHLVQYNILNLRLREVEGRAQPHLHSDNRQKALAALFVSYHPEI